MSVSPKADTCSALAHVCYGPKADISYFIDHHIDASKQRC